MTNIPLSQPDITDREVDEVVSVLRSSRLSLGPKVEEFEALVGAHIGVPHALAVSSGTAGLHLCLCAMGIGPGDEVVVPSFSFIAAANAIRYVGAVPVFVDIEPVTLNLDPAKIERSITSRTRAIMVVHTFGIPAEMNLILEIARKHNLRIIEDACEAIGASYNGQRIGSFGDAAVLAFYPNKQITTGEGGMVLTQRADLAREIKALRNQGRYDSDAWHQHSILGYNYRLSEINSALGCAQMHRLDSILERREIVARKYGEVLKGNPDLVLPLSSLKGGCISWFVYVVRLTSRFKRADRDATVVHMREKGIQCGRYFAPIHDQPAYSQAPPSFPLPVTEAESQRTIALPFFNCMTDQQIEFVSLNLLQTLSSVGTSRV